jgi:deoxyadenosine/deoxycytidine kinase
MNIEPRRQIAVEGCIGVGKTTWAQLLAQLRGSKLVLEAFDKNPFLPAFYSDPVANVLETELGFILIHYHQLRHIAEQGAAETSTDFTFAKDGIFADLNFSDSSERAIFDHLYGFLAARLRAPDLVIYLRGSDQLIFERIRQRNRSMEQEIDTTYFGRLNRAYEEYFARFDGPLHVIDADRSDCLKNPELVEELSRAIDVRLGLSRAPRVEGGG